MKYIILLSLALIATLGAQAQTVATINADATKIAATDAGNYDRIEDLWKMEKGKVYLISLPAELDGYYFGPDAQRMKVADYTKQEDGTYVVTTESMADLEDFHVGKAYIVTPDLDVDTITHITPGIKTELKATEEGKELLHSDQVKQEKSVDGIESVSNMPLGNTVTAIYDIQGHKVSVLHKGETYIVNGKKIIIK